MTKSAEDIIDEYYFFLELPDWKKFEEIKKILDFYIAGEDNNKLLLFFLMIGNYHEKLMSFILYRGDSSAGKNHVIENTLKLFPEKDIYTYDSATAKALNYDDTLNEARVIYLRELEKSPATVEMLKSLYNLAGKIHKETVIDAQTKAHTVKEHLLERKGIITTFSFENIQVDVVNRGWVLVPDQSYEQTQNIITFDIHSEKHLIERKLQLKEMDNRCFFISQCVKLLNFDYDVFIPYIDKLDVLLPNTQLNVRRDKNKLFNLIKIICIWNQKNRRGFKIDDDNYLIAEYIDLKMALQICENLFINLVLHLDDIKKTILDYMMVMETVAIKVKTTGAIDTFGNTSSPTTKQVEKRYTITEIYQDINEETSVSRSTIMRKMDSLFYEGYLLREKTKGKLFYTKLRDYSLVNALRLNEIEEEINSIVDQQYNYYSNKTGVILQDGKREPEKEADDF